MSLNSIMNIATSGLQTAQAQLRVTSDNIANVNTAGYVRKITDQTAAGLSVSSRLNGSSRLTTASVLA